MKGDHLAVLLLFFNGFEDLEVVHCWCVLAVFVFQERWGHFAFLLLGLGGVLSLFLVEETVVIRSVGRFGNILAFVQRSALLAGKRKRAKRCAQIVDGQVM